MHVLVAKPVRNPDQLFAILRFRADGWTRARICRALGISESTYKRRLREAEQLAAEQLEGSPECDD